jgi:hypothetical protein
MSSEKRKWFDPHSKHQPQPLPLPSPLLNTAQLTEQDLQALQDAIHARADSETYALFTSLIHMPPRARLGRNLKVLIGRLTAGPVESILRDGLTEQEQRALVAVERLGLSPELRMTAQALLNVYERYQLAMTLGAAFA